MALTAPPRDPEAAEPICLAHDPDDLLVMYHRPRNGAEPATAVLICPPFGWEEACAFRGLRSWARQLARAGYPTARLSLPSTGDSAGDAGDPDRLGAWLSAVTATADWLRDHAGAVRVCAIGIGLGGMLATAAAAGGAIDDLILWAVPGRGRTLVREMRAHAQIIAASVSDGDDLGSEGDLMLVGYRLAAQTAAALGALDLTARPFPAGPGRRVLLLGRDGVRPDQALQAHLESGGLSVETADGNDHGDLMANPQQSVSPETTIAISLKWLGLAGPVVAQPAGPAEAPHRNAERAARVRCTHQGTTLTETPLWLDGARGGIFAVHTAPANPVRNGTCAVLLGGGALAHTGPNRSWVQLAREWAAAGVATVRLDLGGVGEADGEDPELLTDASFYDPWRDEEVGTIMDQLQAAGVGDSFVLGGLCSGAYQALRRGLSDERVCGTLLLNLYAVLWSQELVSERGRHAAIAGGMPGLLQRARDRERLFTAIRGLRPDRAARLALRSAERAQRREIAQAFDLLNARGITSQLLLVEGEPLLAALERHRLMAELPRWPALEVVRVPSHDHMFRALSAQRFVHAALGRGVRRAVGEPAADPSIA